VRLLKFLFALVIIFIVLDTSGQKLNYGIKIGMSGSSFALDYSNTTAPKMGLKAGLFSSYNFGDYLAVEAGVDYLQRGAANWQDSETSQVNVTMQAIDIPVLITVMPVGNTSKDVFPRVFLGHSATWNISATSYERKYSSVFNNVVFKTEKDISDIVNYFDYGIIAGLGLTFNSSAHIFTIDAGYRFGYSDAILRKTENYTMNSFFFTVGVGL
jgi:hypothetical protein